VKRTVDGAEFLDRQKRMRAALQRLDHFAVADILDEIEPFPLVVGQRYRIRALGGKPDATRVVHAHDDAGHDLHIEYSMATQPEYLELTGTFIRRVYGVSGRRSPGSALYRLDNGQTALLADADIIEIEDA
jgi:hypothetical protein